MHIAIDLGGKKSQVCIRNNEGEILKEAKVLTQELASYLATEKPSRVVMETCCEAFAVARQLKKVGHAPVVVPATLAPALGVGARGLKTDARDARTLSEASARMKNLPAVHIPSDYAEQLKQESASRDLLVKQRVQTNNHIKAWLRVKLATKPKGTIDNLPQRIREVFPELPKHIESILKLQETLTQEIAEADKRLKALGEQDEVCQRLQTIPGVGPITAIRFRGAVDDVLRFESAKAIESYFGLTPGENSSSERVSRTRITKAGAASMRRLLIQCAHVAITNCSQEPMSQWATELMRKKNRAIAVTALARKLCGIMYAVWKTKTNYQSTLSAKTLPAPDIKEVQNKIWPQRSETVPATH